MEENKELETTTEEQASVTPAANNGEKKGLFLSGLIVGFAATLLSWAVSLSLFRSTTS